MTRIHLDDPALLESLIRAEPRLRRLFERATSALPGDKATTATLLDELATVCGPQALHPRLRPATAEAALRQALLAAVSTPAEAALMAQQNERFRG